MKLCVKIIKNIYKLTHLSLFEYIFKKYLKIEKYFLWVKINLYISFLKLNLY